MEITALTRRACLLALAAHPIAKAAFEVQPWPKGKAVPRLALPDLDGRVWSLADLRGKVVLLNFWATWCEPCRAEMPALDALARERAGEGLVVLAVNYQESAPRVRRFLETLPLGVPILLDTDGAAARAWTRRIFPTTVLMDRRGVPQWSVVGEYDWGRPDAARLMAPWLRTVSR